MTKNRTHTPVYLDPGMYSGLEVKGLMSASVEDCVSTLKQHRVNATCLRKVYSRPSDGLVLGQHRRRLTGIEPAMGCDAGPTLTWNLVGRLTSSVRGTS